MAFQKSTILSTRELAVGARFLGQTVPVPSGRLDKVSLYLEPEFASEEAAQNVAVKVRVYAVDAFGNPTGSPLAEDMKLLSEMKHRGDYNFRLEAYVPSTVAVVLLTEGSDLENLVGWRYVGSDAGSEPLLISDSNGLTWAQVSDRKFSYKAFSLLPSAVSLADQTATIRAGTSETISDDTNDDWELAELDQTKIDPPSGATVVIDFGDFLATLVVDQSGSMTWNDRGGLRFTFLKEYIDDFEASLSGTGSTAKYSIVKFRSRQIGSMLFAVQGGEDFLTEFEGVKLIRTPVTGVGPLYGAPTLPSDGVEVFSGFAQEKVDASLSAGDYWYAIFAYAQNAADEDETKFSLVARDRITPVASPRPPIGVAGFTATEVVTDDPVSGLDVGDRSISLSWVNPTGADYDEVLVVRRTDHFPESPYEPGNYYPITTTDTPENPTWSASTVTSVTDFPSDDAINGLTYFYRIWTRKSPSHLTNPKLKCYLSNARTAFVAVSTVNRVWEKADPPFNTPPVAFDNTAPVTPPVLSFDVSVGNKAVKIAWTPWDADAVRYKIFYHEERYPETLDTANGETTYDGDVVYDGDGVDATAESGMLQFVHRELTNSEPHFYAFVAIDRVNNYSDPLYFQARPTDELVLDPILPLPINKFSAECVNSTTTRLVWDTPSFLNTAPDLYFGDSARFLASVTFNDNDGAATSASFEIVELDREVLKFDGEEGDADALMSFSTAPSTNTTSLTGAVAMVDSIQLLNTIKTAAFSSVAALRVTNRTTGELLKEVRSRGINLQFKNPLEISITTDKSVKRRSWDPGDCGSATGSSTPPHYEEEVIPGVYAGAGDFLQVRVDLTFRGISLDEDTDLQVRVLDAATGAVAPGIVLPEANSNGVATITTQPIEEEDVDRSGEPTGTTTDRTVAVLTIPPQGVPGDYVLEVTASVNGYTRTTTLDFVVEPTLNVDMDVRSFRPDNFDRAEQKAFVYLGPYHDESKKVPVTDGVVTEWKLTLIEGAGKSIESRCLYADPPQVPGAGVLATTRDGTARGVFFGPGGGVEPPKDPICTNGELWEISVEVNHNGMIGTGHALVNILGPDDFEGLERIFLRVVDGQQGATEGGALQDGATDLAVARHSIFCDGVMESHWEVLGDPQNDVNRGTDPLEDVKSGVYFHNGIVGSEGLNPGGISPLLQVGQPVTMYAKSVHGSTLLSNVIIETNHEEKAGSAVALVERDEVDGLLKAKFSVRVLARAVGTVLEPPEQSELPSNPVYDTQGLLWSPAAGLISLSVSTVITASGQSFVFGGGGSNLSTSTPPAFISLVEPLACPDSISES